MLVPKLRFKREDGTDYPEWKSLTLGERFTFKNGINASREAFRAEGIHCVGVSDVYKCLPILAKNVIGTVAVSDDEIEKNKVNYGDILFQRSSETREDIGHASVYFDNVPSVYNGFVICAKPDELFYDPLYFHYSLQNTRVRKQTITLGAGSGQHYNIGQEGLAQINAVFPCLEEQQRISDFVYTVDEIIAQSEAEVQNLEQQKKAAMQKIFSQEVRFKREDGTEYSEWEEKIVAEVFKITRGYVLSTKLVRHVADEEYCFPVFSSQTKDNGLMGYYNNYLYENAITWTTDGANAGTVRFRNGKFYCTNVCGVLLNDNGYANQCIAEYLNSIAFKYVSYVGNPKLMNNIMAEIPILIPCLEEQQKIADFLSAYDEAISYAKQELDKWKELKKGLLQQMFV